MSLYDSPDTDIAYRSNRHAEFIAQVSMGSALPDIKITDCTHCIVWNASRRPFIVDCYSISE